MNKANAINVKRFLKAIFIIGAFLLSAYIRPGIAQEKKVNIEVLIRETQRLSLEADRIMIVWWIPDEFWEAALSQNGSLTKEQIEEFIALVRPYTLVAASDGKQGKFGATAYKSEDDVRKSLQFIDSTGTSHRPLNIHEADAEIRGLLSLMKPILANSIGSAGENMHFFLFPASNKMGKKIAEAKKEGSFTVKLGSTEFKWRLPLGSLLPPKACPVDGEQLDGSWKFCPWHGNKLSG